MLDDYGIAWGESIPDSDDNEQVTVPEIRVPSFITDTQLGNLQRFYTLDRILSSDCHAVEMFIQLLGQVNT